MNAINVKLSGGHRNAFTLIELLVVISIIGVLAAFTIPMLKIVKANQYKKVARSELEQIQTALENYKAKYGAYPPSNQKPATTTYDPMILSQLYYELSGTTTTTIGGQRYFVTLDGVSRILAADVNTAYGVAGFVNCTTGSGEDAATARNFLIGLKPNQVNLYVTNNSVQTTMLVTAAGGPDDTYKPLNATGLNPFRYNSINPTNNPNSYDLWIDLSINGKTNRISNWSRQVQILN